MIKIKFSISLLFSFVTYTAVYAQNVGIGTNTPQNKLEINTGVYNNSGLRLTQLQGQSDSAGYVTKTVTTVNTNPTCKSLAIDQAGNKYVLSGNIVFKSNTNGTANYITLNAGNTPAALTLDNNNNIYVANSDNTVTKVTQAGVVTTFASGLSSPSDIKFYNGDLYVANKGNNTIAKITAAGVVSTFANTNFTQPVAMAFDASGSLYVIYEGISSVSKISAAGVVSTFYNGGALVSPRAITVDKNGDLIISCPPAVGKISSAAVYSKVFDNTTSFGITGLASSANGIVYGTSYKTIRQLYESYSNVLTINKSGDVATIPNPVNFSDGLYVIDGPAQVNGNFTVSSGNITTSQNITANTVLASSIGTTFLQVGNGDYLSNIQKGTYNAGASNNQKKSITLNFSTPLSSNTYQIFLTPQNEGGFNDAIVLSVRNKTTTSCVVEICRVDAATGWGQNLSIDWMVVE
jgi:hypothetical protein